MSPFENKRPVFQREQSRRLKSESFQEYFTINMKEFFLSNLPSDDIKAMSPEYLYPIGMVAILSLIGIFLAVFLNGYYTTADTQFLSPTTSNKPMRNCVVLATINTGNYLATEGGVWEGASGFQYDQAAYELSVTSLSLDYETYVAVMNNAYVSLEYLKKLSYTNDLAANLVLWMSQAFLPIPNNDAQRFSFVGTPLMVFDRQKTVGTIANVNGHCNATSKATFNANNGKLALVYDYAEYMATPACQEALDPDLVGYLASTDFNEFSMEFDIRSMVTCVAMNLGVLSVDTLIRIPIFDIVLSIGGAIYNVSSYYDPKYSGMDPITCIRFPATHPYDPPAGYVQCVMLIENQVFAVPMFNHMGLNATYPTPCNCSALAYEQIDDGFDPCNAFNFISGLLFYPTRDAGDVLQLLLNTGLTPTIDAVTSDLNANSYDPMWIDSFWGLQSGNRKLYNTPEFREDAYSFCNLPNSSAQCTFVIFSQFDKYQTNWAISENYYQLETGACQNSFVGTRAEWDALIALPFAPLIHDYQKCNYDSGTIFINQAGSSVGTVSILAPFCITFILALVYFAQVCGLFNIKRTYTNREKADAVSVFAVKLLLARDKDKADLDKDSVIAKLVDELSLGFNSTDEVYHSRQKAGDLDWDAVHAALRLKSLPRAAPVAPPASSITNTGRQSSDDGVEMNTVVSPIHFLAPPGAGALQREDCTIMNDYDVAPAMLQLCGMTHAALPGEDVKIIREGSEGSSSGEVSSPVGISPAYDLPDDVESGNSQLNSTDVLSSADTKETPILDVPALFTLMDKLAEELESAHRDGTALPERVANQTAILRVVCVEALSAKDISTLYYKMYTLLALHAAIELNVSVSEVKRNRANDVAYAVGPVVLTLADMHKEL